MVQYEPCNPRVQGKMERSYRILRKKISFDMVTQIRFDKKLGESPELGNLKNYLKFLNNEKSEELG